METGLPDFYSGECGRSVNLDKELTETTMMMRGTFILLTCVLGSVVAINRFLINGRLRNPDGAEVRSETAAIEWLEAHDQLHMGVKYNSTMASWTYATNITDFNQEKMIQAKSRAAEFNKMAHKGAKAFSRTFFSTRVKRQLVKVLDIGSDVLDPDKVLKVSELSAELNSLYSKPKVCGISEKSPTTCYNLSPGLTKMFAESRDWDELLRAWKGWRDATGPKMADKYAELVKLQNEAAEINGHADTGAYWRSHYETDDFRSLTAELWSELKPLYQHLYAYVRRRLQTVYQDHEFPDTGHIPAHILGNMWAQNWNNLEELLRPDPSAPSLDVSDEMVRQEYDARRIMQLSEQFFTSIGFQPMPANFWRDSMLVRPSGRDVVCHASAWDFYNRKDFRIKQCTEVTMNWLATSHHEMGHVAYYMAYRDQPTVFRRGANPGFHEAIGDLMALSVSTPEHLKKIGLIESVEQSKGTDLNFLLTMALRKVAFLPFGYLIDQWRWDVFSGKTTPENYNRDWWKLRCSIQGISPPVPRSDQDFDPGAKFHIPNNVPYIRYFISFILQFQFHKALCEEAGNRGPLHRCDIYQSQRAGSALRRALSVGSSRLWPEVLRNLTGSEKISVQPLLEYFRPLQRWLEQENEGYDVTWQPECPDGSLTSAATRQYVVNVCLTMFLIVITIVGDTFEQ